MRRMEQPGPTLGVNLGPANISSTPSHENHAQLPRNSNGPFPQHRRARRAAARAKRGADGKRTKDERLLDPNDGKAPVKEAGPVVMQRWCLGKIKLKNATSVRLTEVQQTLQPALTLVKNLKAQGRLKIDEEKVIAVLSEGNLRCAWRCPRPWPWRQAWGIRNLCRTE